MLYLVSSVEGFLLSLILIATTVNDDSALDATDAVIVRHLFSTYNGREARGLLNILVDGCLSTSNPNEGMSEI